MPEDQQQLPTNSSPSRRNFLKASSAGILGAGLALQQGIIQGAYVKANETLKVGLVGCGGRGTGAAAQALRADKNVKLIAMADAFDDQLQKSLSNLQKQDIKDRVTVDKDHQFTGFDAYQKLIATDVDIVLLATPPHFRPIHLRACVDANKHTFVEKPVATDAAGVRSILESTEDAKKKNLTIVSGLCWRYETGMQETISRLQNGAIGDIVGVESTRYLGNVGKMAKRQDDWTEMYYQMRNWYFHTWLSGDFIAEQFIHELDKISWLMGDVYPVKAIATGGRIVRTEEKYGHVYDHFAVIYEYENGMKYHATSRQQQGCPGKFHDIVQGTKGRANLMKYHFTGENPWRYKGKRTVMHQLEHDEMYKALRAGKTINNGDYMAKSTLMAIMGRTAAYTGQEITWDKMLNSKEELGPDGYTWDSKPKERAVAIPGVTPFF